MANLLNYEIILEHRVSDSVIFASVSVSVARGSETFIHFPEFCIVLPDWIILDYKAIGTKSINHQSALLAY